jgi:hypothetical protein
MRRPTNILESMSPGFVLPLSRIPFKDIMAKKPVLILPKLYPIVSVNL